jgi:outer membrane receptor protein involved in Fe transport
MESNKSPVRKLILFTSSLLTPVLILNPAFAQEVDKVETVLEEIVVTASKREVNLQDLAISIKAFTQENLTAMGADTFTDYARMTPSLTFAERGSQRNSMVIRGLGISSGLPTVGVYLDGVPIQEGFETTDPRLFDIERIEILRGPQGTLYGEGSLGGTINIINARPDLTQQQGRFAAEYGNISHGEDLVNFSGMVNLPVVSDTFGIRVVALNRDQGGFIDYPLAEGGVEDGNTDKAFDSRILATWQANEQLKITGIYYYQDSEISFDQAISPTFASAIGDDELVSNQSFRTLWDWTTRQGTLEVDYDLDFANLVANFGFMERERALVDNLLGPAYIDQDTDTKSGEIRLVSNSDGKLDWIVGLFWRDRQVDISADLVGVAEAFGVPAFIQVFNNGYDAKAIYGEVYYSFTDQWRLTAGARYYDEDITTYSLNDIGIPGLEEESTVKNNFSNVSPKLGLEYSPGEDTLVYTSASVGFRSGGNNVSVIPDPNYQSAYDEDRVIAYELGLKQTMADGRMVLNTAVFYNDWTDVQIEGIPGNSSLGFITNGGEAHSTGIEADFSWLPIDGLELTAGGALIEAETDEPVQGGAAGSKLDNVPNKTFNASASYTWPVFADFLATGYVDYSYRGESYGGIPNSPINRAAPYSLSNARLTFSNGTWDISLYVDNITDERGSSFSFNDNLGITDQVFIIRPRTYGIRLQYAFAR